MAFCRNCGRKIPEGNKFCENCGAPVANNSEDKHYQEEPDNWDRYDDDEIADFPRQVKEVEEMVVGDKIKTIDRFGKLYGIGLLILSLIDLNSHMPILTILFSAVIIAGCIFCFARKYKLRVFTIAAIIISILCLIAGIADVKEKGLLGISKGAKYEEGVESGSGDDTDQVEEKIAVESETKTEEVKGKDSKKEAEDEIASEAENKAEKESENEAANEVSDDAAKETVDGVDPELKAFLDSYEEFMNEYVDFMKKYMENPGNAVSMLSDYTAIMVKYEEFAEAIDEYDSDEMSVADAKYYLEVVNRCNQKMLEIYE